MQATHPHLVEKAVNTANAKVDSCRTWLRHPSGWVLSLSSHPVTDDIICKRQWREQRQRQICAFGVLCTAKKSHTNTKTMLAVSYLPSTPVSMLLTTTNLLSTVVTVSSDLQRTACAHRCTDTQECLRNPEVRGRGPHVA